MYEQLTIEGFFADPPESAGDLPPAPPVPDDRPLDQVKETSPRKRSWGREER